MTANEEESVQEFSRKYKLDNNGLPCGWLDLKPSFVNLKYVGNVSKLWKAWHVEGVDVIMKCKYHSSKWSDYWTPAEVKKFSRLRLIINQIHCRIDR
jgi:hypothetical protein